MTETNTHDHNGSVCPECEHPLSPGSVNIRVLTNIRSGDAYLGQSCPECDAILARFTHESGLKPEYREQAEEDPNPPEDWP